MIPIITLSSDFGFRDSYVAQMKGVILSLCPSVTLVDLSHDIAPGALKEAAYFMSGAAAKFPAETIHLAVVDPGVGTKRKHLIVEAQMPLGKQLFVGPDNGIFSLAVPLAQRRAICEIDLSAKYFPSASLSTFDGRDVFAPAAAFLASGSALSALGKVYPGTHKINEIVLPQAELGAEGEWIGEIIQIDRFGNAISNISSSLLEAGEYFAELPGLREKISFTRAYADIPQDKVRLLANSFGLIEVAANSRSASEMLGLKIEDKILLKKQDV